MRAVHAAILFFIIWSIASCGQSSPSLTQQVDPTVTPNTAIADAASLPNTVTNDETAPDAVATDVVAAATIDAETIPEATEAAALVAAQRSELRSSCASDDPAEVDEIVIGALSPGASQAGLAMQAAFKIAIDDINNSGGILGKPVRLVSHNTNGEPETGSLLAERMVTEDCAVGLAGVFHSRVAMAVKEMAHAYGTPIIFADPYTDDITTDQYPEVFRIAPTLTMLAQMEAEWLQSVGDYNQDGRTLVVMLVENSHYGEVLTQSAAKWWPEYGIEHHVLQIDLPTEDFSSEISRIVNLEHLPDIVFTKFNGNSSYLLQQQMLEAGIGPRENPVKSILVTRQSALNHQAYWSYVPEGTYTVVNRIGPWHTTVTEEIGRGFVQSYRQVFDRWPEPYAFEAYDSVRLLAAAIIEANSLAPADIILALENIEVELASGTYTFPYNAANPPDGEEIPAYMWHQWPDVPLLFLQYTESEQDSAEMAVVWPDVYSTVEGPVLR